MTAFNKQQFIVEKKKEFLAELADNEWILDDSYMSDSVDMPLSELEKRFEQSLNEAITKSVQDCIDLSDEIELAEETNMEEWKAFKRFRNTMRDTLLK